MDNSEPLDFVVASKEGVGPLLFHVHDDEESIRGLPRYMHVDVIEYTPVALGLGPFEGTIALPQGAMTQTVPDRTCAEWMWQDGSSLLLLQWAFPHLPLLDFIAPWPSGTFHLLVNDRLMALRGRLAPRWRTSPVRPHFVGGAAAERWALGGQEEVHVTHARAVAKYPYREATCFAASSHTG